MAKFFIIMVTGFVLASSCGQSQTSSPASGTARPATSRTALVGEGCDGCELIYIDMPSRINAVDSSPAWHEPGKKMLLQGTVYRKDGKTPAPGIIVYYHHTDNNGLYSPAPGQNERSRRHGHIRGWVKTDRNGHYGIYTTQPAPYPGRTLPAHIHLTIKEPQINEYYIDDVNFDDDPILTQDMRRHREDRGGLGIVKVSRDTNGLLVCTRDIILGKNIPNYR